MLSILRKGLVYNDISSDIVEHDLDVDADQWSYDDKDVYRGSIDPEYISHGLNVYWLYDDNLKRVGLAEHESKEPEVFKTLWFHDNPFATLYQDPSWKSTGSTIWSKLSNEAYQDYLEGVNIEKSLLNSGILCMTPKRLVSPPTIYSCETCGEKSFSRDCDHAVEVDFSGFSILFLDEDYVLYSKMPVHDASDQEHSQTQVASVAQQESSDAQKSPESPQ